MVPAAAAVLKEPAAAQLGVEEEVLLHGLAGPRLLLHRTQLVEDEGRGLGLGVWGAEGGGSNELENQEISLFFLSNQN